MIEGAPGSRSQAWFIELEKGFRGPGTSSGCPALVTVLLELPPGARAWGLDHKSLLFCSLSFFVSPLQLILPREESDVRLDVALDGGLFWLQPPGKNKLRPLSGQLSSPGLTLGPNQAGNTSTLPLEEPVRKRALSLGTQGPATLPLSSCLGWVLSLRSLQRSAPSRGSGQVRAWVSRF